MQGDRRYRVRGLSKNGSDESLKVNVHASRSERFHLDTLDLYQAKARAAFVVQASIELDVEPALVKADLGAVLGALEQAQDARARAAAAPKVDALPSLSPAQRKRSLRAVLDYRFALCSSERSGLAAKRSFHSRGVSSSTRDAGCWPTRWSTSTR